MKKFLLFIALVMPLLANAQQTEKEKSSSKTIEFLSRDGSFFKKEFINLPTIGGSYNKVECQLLIITDMKSNEKRGCLRLITHYPTSSGNDDYIGTLDPDELDACVMCLEKIQTDIIPSQPEVYTEAEYKTRDGVTIGSYWNEKKKNWTIYVRTKSYSVRSMSTVDSANLPALIQNLKDAKAQISARTK